MLLLIDIWICIIIMFIKTISTFLLSTVTKFVIPESYKSYDLLSEMKEINRLVAGDWGVSEAAAGAETAMSLVQVSAVRWLKYTPPPHRAYLLSPQMSAAVSDKPYLGHDGG